MSIILTCSNSDTLLFHNNDPFISVVDYHPLHCGCHQVYHREVGDIRIVALDQNVDEIIPPRIATYQICYHNTYIGSLVHIRPIPHCPGTFCMHCQ